MASPRSKDQEQKALKKPLLQDQDKQETAIEIAPLQTQTQTQTHIAPAPAPEEKKSTPDVPMVADVIEQAPLAVPIAITREARETASLRVILAQLQACATTPLLREKIGSMMHNSFGEAPLSVKGVCTVLSKVRDELKHQSEDTEKEKNDQIQFYSKVGFILGLGMSLASIAVGHVNPQLADGFRNALWSDCVVTSSITCCLGCSNPSAKLQNDLSLLDNILRDLNVYLDLNSSVPSHGTFSSMPIVMFSATVPANRASAVAEQKVDAAPVGPERPSMI